MTRTRKVMLNTVSTAAYQLTAMLMGFVTPRLMIHFYSSEVNGLIVSITEFMNYFKLVEAGLAATAVYSLYKPLATRNEGQISAIVSAARGFYNRTGLLFTGMTFLFAAIYPFVVKITSLSAFSVFLLAVIMGVSGALEFLSLARYRVLLTADQKTYVVSLAGMASLLLQTALIVLLSVLKVNILVVRLVAGLTILLRVLILQSYVKKRYPFVDYHHAPDKSALAKRYDALYTQLTVSLQQSLGVVLATLILRDGNLISAYGVYHMVVIGLWGILKMVTTGIYSFFGEMLVRKEEERLKRAHRDFEGFYMALCIVVYGTAMVMMLPFVKLYTQGVQDASYVFPLWALLFVLQGLTDQLKGPLDLMVTAAGAFAETRHYNTVQIIVAVVLGTGLGVAFGVPGILVGIIIANVLRGTLQLYYVPKHITRRPWQESFAAMLRAGLTIALAVWLLSFVHINPTGYGQWLLTAFLVALLMLGAALLSAALFDRRCFKSLIQRATQLLKKGV